MSNPERLREGLARHLHRDSIQDGLWRYLEDRGYVGEAELKSLREGIEYLYSEVRAMQTAVLPDRGDAVELRAPRDATTRARIDALSAIYAAWSARDAESFRARYLIRTDDRAAMRAYAAGGSHPGYALLDDEAVTAWVIDKLKAHADGKDPDEYIFELIRQQTPGDRDLVVVLDFMSDGRPVRQSVPRSSALGELAELSQKLAEHYRWHPAWATQFVLAGIQPTVLAYTASAEISYGVGGAATTRVTLTLDPALTPEQVAELYGQLRTAMQPEPPQRAQSLRSCRLAEHVGPHLLHHPVNAQDTKRRGRPRRADPPGTFVYYVDPVDCTWQDLRRTWNARYPSTGEDGKPWRYDSQSNFIRDAQRAFLRLLDPRWSRPGERLRSRP
ncbi:hypothetical protein TR51_28465 [Kitasatospora griseola]|uniref:Uncharacterized protein n=1 Tax=Kitasatospora griseola TaxID=2064 RepID=A0A0D0PR31_KITGR|nr:hypothetical protein [Kitasatospora griseola]KIQ62847.1 hypothetical protein TR51_28465 [Kitasatospora griseola]